MKLLSNPRIVKVVSDKRVMNVVMRGLELRGQATAAVDAALHRLARRFDLATREDVGELKRTVRTLEQELRRLEDATADKGAP
jgi:hypothetical protein